MQSNAHIIVIIYVTIILNVQLYVYETQFLTLREEHCGCET